MQLAPLSLFLIVLHVSGGVESRPRLRRLQPHQAQAGGQEPGAHARQAAAASGPFYLDLRGNAPHRAHLVILPVAAPNNLVVIFDLRRKRFLCVDIKGQLYKSRQKDRGHCFFRHIWFSLAEDHDLFFSASGNWLIKLGGGGPAAVHRGPPEGPSALLGRFVKRQRRSEEVNPSDPLRTESHPVPPAKDADQNQTGAESKETIKSCDDPLRVLRLNGHGSPVKTNIADRAEHE